jgi:hypothetical protein
MSNRFWEDSLPDDLGELYSLYESSGDRCYRAKVAEKIRYINSLANDPEPTHCQRCGHEFTTDEHAKCFEEWRAQITTEINRTSRPITKDIE